MGSEGDTGISVSSSRRHRETRPWAGQALPAAEKPLGFCLPTLPFPEHPRQLFALCSGHVFTLDVLDIYRDPLSFPTPLAL